MGKKRVLEPIPVLDEKLLLQALRDEGIKEVSNRAIENMDSVGLDSEPLHACLPV